MDEPTLVILAAGLGRRYGGMKQVEEVGPAGAFILHYSIFDALRAGFERIVLVVRSGMEPALDASFRRFGFPRGQIEYAIQDASDVPFQVPDGFERHKPWGTAHAVYCCRHVVGEAFGVINADDLYGEESYRLAAEYLRGLQPGQHDYALAGYRLEHTLSPHGSVSRAVCSLEEGYTVRAIREYTNIEAGGGGFTGRDVRGEAHSLPGDAIVSMNFWAFSPAFFQDLTEVLRQAANQPDFDLLEGEFYLPEVVGVLLDRGRVSVRVLPTRARWSGVTYAQDLESVRYRIEMDHQSGRYPANLQLTLVDEAG